MYETILAKLYEHNNWANRQILQACAALSDEQLDAEPPSAAYGSIRKTLVHLVASQQGYLSLLTVPLESRQRVQVAYADLKQLADASGGGLLALARGEAGQPPQDKLQTRDGYFVESWVVMLQAINHATEHREQVCSMLTALGMAPPVLDGWAYGEAAGALVPG